MTMNWDPRFQEPLPGIVPTDEQKAGLRLPGPWADSRASVLQARDALRPEQKLGGASVPPEIYAILDRLKYIKHLQDNKGTFIQGSTRRSWQSEVKDLQKQLDTEFLTNPESVDQFFQVLYEMYGEDPSVADAMKWPDAELPDFDEWAKSLGIPLPPDNKRSEDEEGINFTNYLAGRYGMEPQQVATKYGWPPEAVAATDFGGGLLTDAQGGAEADPYQSYLESQGQPSAINPPQMQGNIWQDEAGNYMQGQVVFNPETGQFEPVGSGMPVQGDTYQSGRGFFSSDPATGQVSPNYIPGAPGGFEDYTGPGGYNWTWDDIAGQAVQGGYDPLQDITQQNFMREFIADEGYRQESLDYQRNKSNAEMQFQRDMWASTHPEVSKGWLSESYDVPQGTALSADSPLGELTEFDYNRLNRNQQEVVDFLDQTGAVTGDYRPTPKVTTARVNPNAAAFRRF